MLILNLKVLIKISEPFLARCATGSFAQAVTKLNPK